MTRITWALVALYLAAIVAAKPHYDALRRSRPPRGQRLHRVRARGADVRRAGPPARRMGPSPLGEDGRADPRRLRQPPTSPTPTRPGSRSRAAPRSRSPRRSTRSPTTAPAATRGSCGRTRATSSAPSPTPRERVGHRVPRLGARGHVPDRVHAGDVEDRWRTRFLVPAGPPARPGARRGVIHYHGTPLTPRSALLTLAGRSFCVPWPEPRDLEVCHEIGEGVMLDNGAFSLWTRARRAGPASSAPDWTAYYAWAEPWLDYPTTWAVIPDVIDGDEEANDLLLAYWPFGARGAPVWHMHESINRLLALADRFPRVSWRVPAPTPPSATPVGIAACRRRWTPSAATAPSPSGCTCCAASRSPAATTRSRRPTARTSIARNHAGNNTRHTPPKSPRAMADDIDSRQCPAR